MQAWIQAQAAGRLNTPRPDTAGLHPGVLRPDLKGPTDAEAFPIKDVVGKQPAGWGWVSAAPRGCPEPRGPGWRLAVQEPTGVGFLSYSSSARAWTSREAGGAHHIRLGVFLFTRTGSLGPGN